VPASIADRQDLLNFVGRMRDKPPQVRQVYFDARAKAAPAEAVRRWHPWGVVMVS